MCVVFSKLIKIELILHFLFCLLTQRKFAIKFCDIDMISPSLSHCSIVLYVQVVKLNHFSIHALLLAVSGKKP